MTTDRAPAVPDLPAVAQLVAVLGRGVLPRDTEVVGADDLGLTRGDGCFDATRVRSGDGGPGEADHLERHLARFASSAAKLEMPPLDAAAWRALVAEALQAWTHPGEAVLKVMLTRGLESSPSAPTGVLTITALGPGAIAARSGIDVVTLSRGHAAGAFTDAPWLLGGVKSLSYAVNTAAKREAARRGAGDCLFVTTDGFALEGPTSALIALTDGALVTTPVEGNGILASITQEVIFEAAAARGIPTAYQLMTIDQLRAAQGVWLVSSVRGVAPVRHLDGDELAADAELDALVTSLAGF